MSGSLQELSQQLAGVVKEAGASVVRVNARRRYPASGIVWSADGVIVTAHHVVRRDEGVTVGLADGRELAATLVGRDPSIDLAVLRVEASDLPLTPWADEKTLAVGALVLALGRPGASVQAALGILSAVGGEWRTHGGGKITHYLRPDLVMYPGFSGGGIVDASGRIVGMATSALTRDGGVALPRPTVEPVVQALLTHGKVRRGYLGVGVQPAQLPGALAEELGQQTGVLFNSVEPGSPAEESGLLVGDILVNLDGAPILHPEDLALALRGDRAGRTVPGRLVRGGRLVEVQVKIGEREGPHA